MEWGKVADVVKKYAPVLGNVVGNFVPGAGAIGTGVSLIASAFGVEEDPDQIYEAIKADPEAALKLKQIETDNQQALANIALTQEEARLQDVQSARQRQVEHEKTTGKTDINLYVLAWIVVVLFFALTGTLMFVTMPDKNIGPVNQLFGAMATGFGCVLQYFFGSSKGSQAKTDQIAELNNLKH